MGSGFGLGKKIAQREPGLKGLKEMTLSHESKAATKVIAKACSWADHRKDVQIAAADQKARALGRYRESGNELAEAVEKYRKEAR